MTIYKECNFADRRIAEPKNRTPSVGGMTFVFLQCFTMKPICPTFISVKTACYILVFMVSWLTSCPCKQSTECTQGLQTETHKGAMTDTDTCPPFCECSCCQSEMGQPVSLLFVEKEFKASPSHAGIAASSPQHPHHAVWQPPKKS